MSRMIYAASLAADAPLAEACTALIDAARAFAASPVRFCAVQDPEAARALAAKGKCADLVDAALAACSAASQGADFTLCEGLAPEARGEAFALAVNTALAAGLGAPVVLVMDGEGRAASAVAADIAAFRSQLGEQRVLLAGVLLSGMDAECAGLGEQLGLPVASSAKALAPVLESAQSHVTPRIFEFGLIEKARRHAMRIVLPEGEEDRLILAAGILLRREVAKIILIGDPEKIRARAAELGTDVSSAEIVKPADAPYFEDFAATYAELRAKKGITLEQARERMTDATYFGTMMIYKGMADGMVSGAVNTTAHTVRPALEFIKTKPGASIVSSAFFVCLKDRVNTYGDCAINLDPDAAQLADIAVTTADTAKAFGLEPRVAMLSYSTGTSGKGPSVDKVREATRLAKEKAPGMLITGPIQYDAAVDPVTARTKMPGDPVAGQASVFIVPDINTGNNLYKAVQRSADAVAIGPVLQGLRKPVNDLSRGCTVPDIVNTVAITAIQAQADKGLA